MAKPLLTLQKKLKESGLTSYDNRHLKMVELSASKTKTLAKNYRPLRSIKLPYFDINGKKLKEFHRIRYLEKPKVFGKEQENFRKYDQPAGTMPALYLPPLVKWKKIANDSSIPIFITEGELKACCSSKNGFPTIGLGGVYSWKSRKHKLHHLPEFDEFDWVGRDVYIIFDSDLSTNSMVQMALYDLAAMLTELGTHPWTCTLPDLASGKTGLDDFIVAKGVDTLKEVLNEAEPFLMARELWKMNTEVVFVDELKMVLRRQDNLLMRKTDFTEMTYAHWHMTVDRGEKTLDKNVASEWLRWPHRSQVKRLVYEPGIRGLNENGSWSTWPGWGCSPKKGNLKPWHDMMKYAFNGDKEALDWFHKWLAIQVQQPGIKLHTAVCMWSRKQGTGKGLIGETMGKIFGDNSSEVNWYTLQNNRNDWAQYKQLIIGNEISGSDKRAVADQIKNLITQERIIIDQKYVPSYSTRDTINYYFTSNHPNAFYIDSEDRRLFVWCIEDNPMPMSFYINFREWKDAEGPSALFDYLLKYDLDDFDHKTRAMKTKYHEDMVEVNRSDLEDWVATLLKDPESALKTLDGKTRKCDLYTASQLKEIYEQHRGYTNRITSQGMGLALRKLGFKKTNQRRPIRTNAGIVYLFSVREHDFWQKASHSQLANHYNDYFGKPKRKGGVKKF